MNFKASIVFNLYFCCFLFWS